MSGMGNLLCRMKDRNAALRAALRRVSLPFVKRLRVTLKGKRDAA